MKNKLTWDFLFRKDDKSPWVIVHSGEYKCPDRTKMWKYLNWMMEVGEAHSIKYEIALPF